MRSVRYYVATTLDGFIADAEGGFDFFVHDDALVADMFAALERDYTAVVMGRATYEVGLAQGVVDPYPWLDTYVVSTTLDPPEAPNVTVLRDIDSVETLVRGEGGRIWLCGGGALASAMNARGLVHELELKVSPVVLGQGIPLFRELPGPLSFVPAGDARCFDSGIRVTRYARAPD